MIELRNVHKTYYATETPQYVLKGVSLSINEGEFICIMGASGSGKSTLLNILGILDSYDEGDYLLEGISIKDLDRNEKAQMRSKYIGFVFQKNNLINFKNVEENVELPMIYSGMKREMRKERTLRLLNRVGIDDLVKKMPNQLSGGQQQRVAIARAMAMYPKMILADEPTGALDSKTSQEIMDLFLRINKQYGVTIIMVTHEESLARQAKRIISVKDGNLVDDIVL
ncbi:MAG: ABC transporter ATP-binding protein [Bacteroidaceae bacterium]|nr:ABC transporter ATP-binding protein [Bacteroidaceae bacterium]